MEELESKWHHDKYTSFVSGQVNVNMKRGAYVQNSGPMGFLSLASEGSSPEQRVGDRAESTLTSQVDAEAPINWSAQRAPSLSHELQERSPAHTLLLSGREKQVAAPVQESTELPSDRDEIQTSQVRDNCTIQQIASNNELPAKEVTNPTFAHLLVNGEPWKKPVVDEGWELVQRKRLRNKYIGCKGNAESSANTRFKAAEEKLPIFIYNVHKDVGEQDIRDYVYQKTSERVSLVKVKMRRQKDYHSYKLFVSSNKINMYLDEKFWPKGIYFRRFISVRDRQSNLPNDNGENGSTKQNNFNGSKE